MNSFSFTVLLALSLMASSSVALPTGKDRSLSPQDMNRVMEAVRKALPGPPPAEDQEGVQDLLRQALIKNKASPRQSGGGDDGDVVGTLTDLVKTNTEINGLNSFENEDTDVTNTATKIGSVDVLAGGSGETTRVRLGDMANVHGHIQGNWFTFNIANVDVQLD